DHLAEDLTELKKQKVDGFNVTIPYKQAVIPFLDELDPAAERIGAVNTVVSVNGKWKGYNTDGEGYIRALTNNCPGLAADKTINIMLIGAGGAARAIYDALTNEEFYHIDIANRTIDHAEDIAALGQKTTQTSISTLKQAEKKLHHYDLIIQTTPVGMHPHTDETVISCHNLQVGSVASDIVYRPLATTFLKEAESFGAQILYGHDMLLYQAQSAFKQWTDTCVNVADLKQPLQTILEV